MNYLFDKINFAWYTATIEHLLKERLLKFLITISDMYDLEHTLAKDYLRDFRCPWEAVTGIRALIEALGPTLPEDYSEILPGVWVHATAEVAASASIQGPCILGPGTQVRHCAFIRGSALVGAGCVVGNSVELKNVILFDGVQVPHFNYVGDSILGYKAHMGAGAVTSNVKSDKTPVVIHGETDFPTGLKKLGAMVGDFAEIGCNSVLNPGTIIGRAATVYPGSSVRGIVPAGHIFKAPGHIVPKR